MSVNDKATFVPLFRPGDDIHEVADWGQRHISGVVNEVLVHWRDLRVIEQETLRLAVCIALEGPEKFARHVLL